MKMLRCLVIRRHDNHAWWMSPSLGALLVLGTWLCLVPVQADTTSHSSDRSNYAFSTLNHCAFASARPDLSAHASASIVQSSADDTEWTVTVVDQDSQPVASAMIYHDGQLVTTDGSSPALTDENGLLTLDTLTPGKPIVAIVQVQEQATLRDAHDGWAYRTYLTSLNLDDTGVPHPDVVGEPGEQLVTIRRDNPLILFNVVVSVEWDADDAYMSMVENAFHYASDYLYDVVDGQMAFGQVHIYDSGRHWDHADFQISARNTVRPHAFWGGITSGETENSIRTGRLWDGSSGNQGYWDEPNGYRTLIHLFGHYALYLYDEYFVSLIDVDGHIIGQAPAACTGVEVLTNDDDATNASIMYYQYNASELADDDRWTVNCQNTEQARVNGQSDWQTVLAHFGGPEWEINTPTNRGSVMAGPDEFPRHLLSFPSTQRHNTGTDSPLRHLTVLAPDDQPFPNAVVTLYTPPYSDTTIIDQGLVDGQGQIAIYGASAGDIVQALSFDRTLRAAATIDGRLTYTLTLRPTGLDERHAQPGSYLTLVPSSEEGSLFLLVQGLPDENCFLSAEIFPSDVEDPPQRIQLDCQTTGRVCTGHVSGISLGGGEIRITGVAGGQPVVSDTEYDLMLIDDAVENNLVSGDANLRIQIDAGSLPIDTAYAVLAASNRAPGPFPIGKQVSGKAYQIRFSGAITGFERPALLTIGPHPAWGGESGDLALYHWDTVAKEWEWVIDEWGEPDNSVTAPVERLGTYALMGDEPFRVFLPVVLRQ